MGTTLNETVPAGFAAASYGVTAQRSGGGSPASEPAVVYLGVATGEQAEAA